MIIELPHGGSGTGIHYWGDWRERCLVAMDFADRGMKGAAIDDLCHHHPALHTGTIFHALCQTWHNGASFEDTMCADVVDNVCGVVSPECLSEARRLFADFAICEKAGGQYPGKILGVELQLGGAAIDAAVGISPFTAQLDLVYETAEGALVVRDYKTAARSGDDFGRGLKRLQIVAYSKAAEVHFGRPVDRFEIVQAVKTKAVQIHVLPQPLPWAGEIAVLQRHLANAVKRKTFELREPLVTQCQYCPYTKPGLCSFGL